MSLYTYNTKDALPDLPSIAGLHIEVSTDINLLMELGEISRKAVLDRFANNHIAFVAFLNGVPAAFGWMARSQAFIGELNQLIELPEGNRYLWNFRTVAAFRGKGIYPALLQFILQYEAAWADQFWIIHAPENRSSRNGIVKAGFTYTGNLFVLPGGGTGFKSGHLTIDKTHLIQSMGFTPTQQYEASCWNCNSPYLKNRSASCCCESNNQLCKSQLITV
ncbi:hypothetical protein GCM10027036_32150 [Flavihumibacter cheonanensis]|uniref:N-acetyltransferase n=1 Tax=Flavihumibacter cheonanensis TaxID=1442385 RepID=UPI001EF937FE|nr:N-acetyltransferase [Flavihumibacter cheonanensis]MCG7752759.1 N-acetyltransferase [Flavihumibacter cheonanensis]